MNKRSTMPTKTQVFNAWAKTSLFDLKSNFWDCPDEYGTSVCWACGWERSLERAHIVPIMDGGSNEWSNLVLLCHKCHKQSEGMREHIFWAWFWGMSMAISMYRDSAGLMHVAELLLDTRRRED